MFRFCRRSAAAAREDRLERLRQVLLAARQTDYYRPLLAGARLDRPDRIASLRSLAQALERLPPLSLSRFLAERSRFRNPAAPERDLPSLVYPHDRTPRTAILASGFRQDGSVRLFPAGWSEELLRFRPQVLAGPTPLLRRLTLDVRAGKVPLYPLTHALIAFTAPGEPCVSCEDRDLFWRVHRVPVFEQIVGFGGELLAWECEAHTGLHVNTGCAVFETLARGQAPGLLVTSLDNLAEPLLRLRTGCARQNETTLCACGCLAETLRAAAPVLAGSAVP